jgi:Pel9A-like, right handed beta helix region/Immunoglobulin I-set domain
VVQFSQSLLQSGTLNRVNGMIESSNMARFVLRYPAVASAAIAAILFQAGTASAALLAYEPFTNAPGAALFGSSDGFGFSGAWQDYQSSLGVATNTGFGLGYTDGSSNRLVTAGGAGFFQGLTSGNTSMQPIRLFNFSRGTNGADGVTTWISFIVVRQGPTGNLAGNPYGRGANIDQDFNSGNLQKLAIGNSSGANTNTVGLIPLGNSGNLKPSAVPFGNFTNFVVVRIDHKVGANDSAWLFVNPILNVEPSTNAAAANSLGSFDFSFNRLRAFVGGENGTAQHYAEMVLDEYRVGETYADVTPYTVPPPPVSPATLIITNTVLTPDGIVLSGIGGSSNATYVLLAGTDVAASAAGWSEVMTNAFDANGDFILTNPLAPGSPQQFYRLRIAGPLSPVGPWIVTQPTNQSVAAGQTAGFVVAAEGTAPLSYQWFFNTNTLLTGASAATLAITNAQTPNTGGYSVRVSNGVGSVTSVVAFLTVIGPPAITLQPTNQSAIYTSNVTFSVIVAGTAPLAYQWYVNTNTVLDGASNASLSITAQLTNNGNGYFVIVTNSYGSATSSVAMLTVYPSLVNGAFFTAPTGNDSNPGTQSSPFLTIGGGLTAISTNGVLYLRGGTYAQSAKLNLNRNGATNNAIRIWAYPGETPVINASGNTSDCLSLSGKNYHLKGLVVMLAGHNGINISGSSNTVEFCTTHDNGNTGLHITGGTGGTTFPAYNLILNCDSYLNYDPPIGGNADGFSAKWDLGAGNVFRGCRAWWNSDDGWDLWMGTSPVLIDQCWAFYSGTNYWNSPQFDGNGNGFKLGGNYIATQHRLVRSVAFRNQANGVDQNNNTAGQIIDQNTGWANLMKNFNLNHNSTNAPMQGVHVLRNNLSIAGGSSDSWRAGSLLTNNSWQVISPAANNSDVLSVDESVAVAPRQSDGSLPVWPFLRPVPGGRLIDQGIDIGDPFSGAAPDLGAFEYVP